MLNGLRSVKQEKIAAELAADKSLGSNVFGRFILKNCKVYKFQQKNTKWHAAEEANERKRKLFEVLSKLYH